MHPDDLAGRVGVNGFDITDVVAAAVDRAFERGGAEQVAGLGRVVVVINIVQCAQFARRLRDVADVLGCLQRIGSAYLGRKLVERAPRKHRAPRERHGHVQIGTRVDVLHIRSVVVADLRAQVLHHHGTDLGHFGDRDRGIGACAAVDLAVDPRFAFLLTRRDTARFCDRHDLGILAVISAVESRRVFGDGAVEVKAAAGGQRDRRLVEGQRIRHGQNRDRANRLDAVEQHAGDVRRACRLRRDNAAAEGNGRDILVIGKIETVMCRRTCVDRAVQVIALAHAERQRRLVQGQRGRLRTNLDHARRRNRSVGAGDDGVARL